MILEQSEKQLRLPSMRLKRKRRRKQPLKAQWSQPLLPMALPLSLNKRQPPPLPVTRKG